MRRTHLQVPFLNLMANIVERAGSVYLRWGGNTQEYARLVPDTEHPRYQTFGKTESGSLQTVRFNFQTPDAFDLTGNRRKHQR